MFLEIVAIPFHAYTRSVMIEQGHPGMNQEGTPFTANSLEHLADRQKALLEVTAVNRTHLDAVKSASVFGGILSAGLSSIGGDIPAVVLHQEKNRQLAQGRHLESFRHLAFRDRGITQRTDDHWRAAMVIFTRQTHLLPVLKPHRHAGSRNGLHAGSR